jgi:flagellar assembly protein FliH
MGTIIRTPAMSDERRTLTRSRDVAAAVSRLATPGADYRSLRETSTAHLSPEAQTNARQTTSPPATAAQSTASPTRQSTAALLTTSPSTTSHSTQSATAQSTTSQSPSAQSARLQLNTAQPNTAPHIAPGPEAPDEAATFRKHQQLVDAELASTFALAENRGFECGLAKAQAAGMEALKGPAARVAAIAAALADAKATVLAEAEDTLVEIVLAATARILGNTILTREGIVGAVECATRTLRDQDQLVVRLHPRDADLLREAWDTADKASAVQATVREDHTIILGGCIVDSARGSLDARLDTQLAALRETLLAVRRRDGCGEPA